MSLAVHLREQLNRLEQLQTLLRHERQLLAAGDIDGKALNAVAELKQQLLAAIDRFETHRRQVRDQLGYGSDHAGDEAAASASGCRQLWRDILERTSECARLNAVNGKLVNLRMVDIQRLLNDLNAMVSRNMYGPDGQPRGNDHRVCSRA
ncbi:MAG TPA: flagellar protein FlgN [Oleiagrimonas sp.]|nr:flagellar protein FlgN [Oleiagrimonas sp.]